MTAGPLLNVSQTAFAARTPRRPDPRSTVARPRLLRALGNADGPPLAVLVAPAGFGKTTLLREWAARDARPFAWITLDPSDDDSVTLLRTVARAIDAARASAPDGRVVLVLDDVHVLRSPEAHKTVAAITTQLPTEISVALASRTEPPMPLARLRAEGMVTEIRHGDLAMTRPEVAALVRLAGLQLGREDADALHRSTEGWPAALSLAVRSLGDQSVPGAAVARFGGDDRLVADYLRDEVLAGLSDDEREFVLRTSVLEVLSAAVCDAVLEQSGSAAMLARLQRSNFPLVALDRTAERHRHHRLLADMLRAELRRNDPELETALHRRASEWHARVGDRERGLRHALAAHEIGRAGDLVWAGVPRSVERGSVLAVDHWLNQFDDSQLAAHPRLALAAAGAHLAHGRGHLAEHWIAAAEAAGPDIEIAGGAAALHGALGRDGLARMGEDAQLGSALLAPENPCQALCRLVGGVADHLRGDREAARVLLEDGARRAAVAAPQVQALCLSQLALLTLDDDDWEGAARLIVPARSQVARYGLARYPTSALVLAVSALVHAHRGRADEARDDARAAARLFEELTELAPWYAIEIQIVLGRTALRLSDINDARARLADADRLLARIHDAVVLREWLQEADTDLQAFTSAASPLASSLTSAELRILNFLPSHLSFREIAESTHVSANTVKTQANSVYRKLNASSRSEAVTYALELGLLCA